MSEKTKTVWVKRARNLLKGELARRGMSYSDLSVNLRKMGIKDAPENIRNKINRGTFSASFLLQALEAIGCKSLNIGMD